MAMIGELVVPDELRLLFAELVRFNNYRQNGGVVKNGHLLNKYQKQDIAGRSLLPEIRDIWYNMSSSEQNDWKLAAAQNGQRAWNLFVQDTSYRIKWGLSGIATPNLFHQYKVGKMEINAPANGARLVQYHPIKYWKMQKVPGTKSLYVDVAVEERLQLPLTLEISYKTQMTAQSGSARIRYYAQIFSSYQGRDIETEVGIDIPLSTDWARQTITATEVLGVARSYNLWLEFVDCRGEFWWDNTVARHTGTNYARDPRCSDVNNTLTRINYQIEKSWEEEFLPNGSAFDSVYPL